jgi:hypothetical protein
MVVQMMVCLHLLVQQPSLHQQRQQPCRLGSKVLCWLLSSSAACQSAQQQQTLLHC